MNPYWGQNFFGFFVVLLRRLFGKLPQDGFPTDEVQLLVLIAVAISTISLGNFLTLKKITMLANSLSHTALLGVVLSYIIFFIFNKNLEMGLNLSTSTVLTSALISAFLTTFLTEFMRDRFKLQEDAAIGVVFTTLFALGVTFVTAFTRNSHIGIEVITGNSDALHSEDIRMAWLVAILVLLFIGLFFRHWVITAFDENLSSFLGLPTKRLHYLMMFLTALTVISAFRAVGVLLVLSFIVGPPLIARRLSCRLIPIFFLSLGLGLIFSIVGVALSRHLLSVYDLPLSTGGSL